MMRHLNYAEAVKSHTGLSTTRRTQTPDRDNTLDLQEMKVLKAIATSFIPTPGSPIRNEDRALELLVEIETLRNAIEVREQELARKKDNVREVEQRLKDLVTENPDLERKLLSSERDKSVLDRRCRELLGRFRKVETTERKYGAAVGGDSERDHHFCAQCKSLSIENVKVTRTNRNQEQEIKALWDSNLKIRAKLEERVAQLNKLTGEIARKTQQVNTSAIRDDEYFAGEFAGLATDIRNWSFTHFFHSKTLVPRVVARDLRDDIREITEWANPSEIFKNRATGRRVVAGLLADKLRKEFFDPLLLGLVPKEFTKFENIVNKTSVQKSQWLSHTISLLVKSKQFEEDLSGKVHVLSQDLRKRLGGFAGEESDESKASKRNQKLSAIVERAAHLAVEVSQQPYRFHARTISPGDQFVSTYMRDVERELSWKEGNPGKDEADHRVSLSVFPYVYREEHVEGGDKVNNIVINQAWVAITMGNSHTTVNRAGGDTTDEEAGGNVGSREGRATRENNDEGKPWAEGEGSQSSPHPKMSTTERAVSVGSISPGLQEDVDLACEKMERVSLN